MNNKGYKIEIKKDDKYGYWYYISSEYKGTKIQGDWVGYKNFSDVFEDIKILINMINEDYDLELTEDIIIIKTKCINNFKYKDESLNYFIDNNLIIYNNDGACSIDTIQMKFIKTTLLNPEDEEYKLNKIIKLADYRK